MAAIQGQPSPKPSSVKKPVPGASAEDEASAFLANYQAPQVGAAPAQDANASAPSPAQNEADQFLGQSGQQPQAPGPDQFAPEPTFLEANTPGKDAVGNFITRLQTGLAANDQEKLGFLQKKYGPQNATIKDGKLYYRKSADEKFQRLDPAAFELVNDILPDFAREIVTEAGMIPGEAAGFAAGGPGGAYAGRIASVPLANRLANATAQAAGVPQDPSRNQYIEDALGMGLEAALPVVGKQIAKRIPGTAIYQEAKAAAEKEVVALSKQSQEVVQAAKSLEQEGINAPLMLHQYQPDSPKVQSVLSKVRDSGEFINKQMQFAEGYGDAVENTLMEIARRDGHGPVAPAALAEKVTNAVTSLDRAEGKAIGEFRSRALANLGNEKQQIPSSISEEAMNMMQQLGFTRKDRKIMVQTRAEGIAPAVPQEVLRRDYIRPRDLNAVEGRLGLDKSQVNAVSNTLEEFGKLISRGNEARLTDVERLISRMGPMNEMLQGTGAAASWGKMTSELRQFRRDIIGKGLSNEFDAMAFNKVMDDFSLLRQSKDQLSSALRGDVTAKTIVGNFFRGKENLANIRAIKSITGKDSPEWGALKEEFINQLLLKHGSPDSPTSYNSQAFLNDLRKNYGDDFIKEVLDDGRAGPNYDTVKNLLTYGARLEASMKGVKADKAAEEQKKAIADAGVGFFAGIKFKMINGAMRLLGADSGQEKALFEIFNRDGFEKYVAGYKGKEDKSAIASNIEKALSLYNASRAAQTVGEATKRATRATGREYIMGHE
jgi:hypothetical protein